ncbi:GyrI-like domain-containing protein [Shewanella psychropiezotolerans]|uniref:GyrI-like domain-containing protein n=1 Tax=Shewanella psychropiezotolerans TaxID=2593655 RepID=A0ABX5X2L8_9GAMM|nr:MULTISPECIES: GyrI-like domain-containing protein [Shewanella]MPY21384.1 GyrI-like domain-containing protein [Shewanella sp. YLB-07]MPY22171.1 GyrI-like domain-containing protein [Shewanella sp. YLB-07]QDO84977.1 GyrI-like domain-containing protein [Shewanella psychropiezotolerans]
MTVIKEDVVSPVLVTQEVIELRGLAVRTSNRAEQVADTQKIGPLWQQFISLSDVQSNMSSPVYGSYYDYESDHNGEFSVLAGLVVGLTKVGADNSELTGLTLAAGEYLRFSAIGEMPAVVISLWGQVWHYFNDENCQFERSYSTDYECYTSNDGVDIYIGIKLR